MKKGDHREYAKQRAAERKAEARALRDEDSDAESESGSDESGEMSDPEDDVPGGDEDAEREPETEIEDEEKDDGDEEKDDGDEEKDEDDEEKDDEEEDEVEGSDKFSDRPATSPDRPDGVPKLDLDKKKKKKGGEKKKKDGEKKKKDGEKKKSKKKKKGEDSEDEGEASEGDDSPVASPDKRPPGRRRGETMRALHKGAMRSARGYRSSDDEDLSDGLDREDTDSEYGGYTARSQFDGKTEFSKLSKAAISYGKETTLGADGDRHRMEDLPIKMAFEHLSSLAGMSAKVQDAITMSKNLFQRRMDRMDRGVLHKAWRGWLMVQLGFQKKKNVLRRAVAKMRRRKMYGAFYAWWESHSRAKKVGAMGTAARVVVTNGMKRRTFQAWRAKTADARRQTIMANHTASLREEFLERLVEVGLRQLVHKRMRKAWSGFEQFADARRGRRNKMRQALARALRGCESRAFQRWVEQTEKAHMGRALVKRAVGRMSRGKLARCFEQWHAAERHKKRCLMKIAKGAQARAFAKWRANIALRHKVQRLVVRWAERGKVAAFAGWAAAADLKREQKARCDAILARMMRRGMRNAWKQWCWVVEDATGCSMDHVRALKDQNARLRRDNERFVRLVDSGEWGRGRVEELTEAGRVLRDERRQLEELIKNIKSEKEGFVKDAMMQAQEARGLKDRLVSGNFVQRNKMTVRGGSSFNTIQRVLKQDLLETGAAARNPQALRAYKVDRLAMNKVSVFSDGEINVQATRAQRREPFDRQARAGAGAGAGAGARLHGRPTPPPIGGAPPRRGAGAPGSSSRGRAGSQAGDDSPDDAADAGQSMLAEALSGLSPEEVDALEDILKRGRAEKENAATASAGGR